MVSSRARLLLVAVASAVVALCACAYSVHLAHYSAFHPLDYHPTAFHRAQLVTPAGGRPHQAICVRCALRLPGGEASEPSYYTDSCRIEHAVVDARSHACVYFGLTALRRRLHGTRTI